MVFVIIWIDLKCNYEIHVISKFWNFLAFWNLFQGSQIHLKIVDEFLAESFFKLVRVPKQWELPQKSSEFQIT